MAPRNAPVNRLRYLLLALALLLPACDPSDDGSDSTVSIASSPAVNPVYVGEEVGFTASYTSGSAVSIISSQWDMQSGPGSYVLNSSSGSTQATGAFYSPGTYVITFTVTYVAADASVQTATAEIDLHVMGGAPG